MIVLASRIYRDNARSDDESTTRSNICPDQWPATTQAINEHDTSCFSTEGDYRVAALE